MGCSGSKSKIEKSEDLEQRLIDCIQRDNSTYLGQIIKVFALQQKLGVASMIDQPVLSVKGHIYNLLAYSVIEGGSKSFNYLLTEHKASFEKMQENFSAYKQNPFTLICQKGYLDLLKVFLPIYMESNKDLQPCRTESTSSSHNKDSVFEVSLPVHEACRAGHINIIHYLHKYFINIPTPLYLDVNAIDWVSDENIALISVRAGNFVMMKHLHEFIHADFHLINAKQEGAMQILATSARSDCSLDFYNCAMYLVEVIQIDISYMYEEALALMENRVILKYFKESLKKIGIEVDSSFKDEKFDKILNISVLCSDKDLSSIMRACDASSFVDSINF